MTNISQKVHTLKLENYLFNISLNKIISKYSLYVEVSQSVLIVASWIEVKNEHRELIYKYILLKLNLISFCCCF